MGCVSPILIKDPRNLLVGGYPVYLQVPCGHCLGCLKKRQNDWSIRVAEELKNTPFNCFLTLTYRDESVPKGINLKTGEERNSLCSEHLTKFIKYMRRELTRKGFPSPRVFCCGEYGSRTFRPHYHCCISGAVSSMLDRVLDYWRDRYGFVLSKDIGLSQKDRQCVGMYVGKYSSKGVFIEKSPLMVDFIEKPFLISSHFLGIRYMEDRLDYFSLINEKTRYESFDDFIEDFTKNFVYTNGRFTYSMPTYYKDYFFSHVDGNSFLGSIVEKTSFDPSETKIIVNRYGFIKNGFKSEKAVILPSLRTQIALSIQRNSDLLYCNTCRKNQDDEGLQTMLQMDGEKLSAKYTLLESSERSLNSFYKKSKI